MRFRRMAAAAGVCLLAVGTVFVPRAEGAVGLDPTGVPTSVSDAGARRVQGTVDRLEYRVAGGYPVTDVHLQPGGEVFTILGGMQDGVLWVAEEEISVAPGDAVDLLLVPGANGWQPSRARYDGPRPPAWESEVRPFSEGLVPRVRELFPPAVPAVADANMVLEVRGENFGRRQGHGAVLFQGLFDHVPGEVISWTDERIICLLPKPGLFNTPQVLSGAVKVWTPRGGWSDGTEWSGQQVRIPFQYAGDKYPDETLPIRVRFNPAGFPWPEETVRGVLERSLETWNEVEESYADFVLEGTTQAVGERRRDGLNVVSWTDPWPHASAWLAVTWSAFDPRTGRRIETDVEINSSVRWSVQDIPVRDAYDLRSVLTHEFGHWLRLGHVQNPGSVMNAFINRNDAVWRLSSGDRMGAAWIYPTFGSVSASPSRVVVGSTEPLVLRVRVVNRLGAPRVSVPAEAIYADLEWEGGRQAVTLSNRPRVAGPYFAARPTDTQGRTEIRIPAPQTPGRASISVTAGGTQLFERASVEFTTGGATDAATGGLTVLGSNPGHGSGVRAEVRLSQADGPFRARIYDARGRVVAERDLGRLAAGANEIRLDLAERGAMAGVFFLEISGPSGRQIAKFVRLR